MIKNKIDPSMNDNNKFSIDLVKSMKRNIK